MDKKMDLLDDPDDLLDHGGDDALVTDGRAWYVSHCYSGYENKVRHSSEQRIETMGMQDHIFDVVVPTEEEIEIKEGKRRTVERRVFPGYRPQFYIRTMDVTGLITLPEGVEMVMPGDNVNMKVELITPVALEEGAHFAIREGGLTVGAGVITKIIK